MVAIAAGETHSLALKGDGTVLGWGNNASGQTNVPAGLNDVLAIAAGSFHNLALRSNGTVIAWGNNYFGQTNTPAGLSNVVAVAAAWTHNLVLKSDGTVAAWGDDSYGQTQSPAGLSNVVAIAARDGRNMAITAPLRITMLEQAGTNTLLRFHAFAGRLYAVEYSNDLTPGSWVELQGAGVQGNGLDVNVTDPFAGGEATNRFYRIREFR